MMFIFKLYTQTKHTSDNHKLSPSKYNYYYTSIKFRIYSHLRSPVYFLFLQWMNIRYRRDFNTISSGKRGGITNSDFIQFGKSINEKLLAVATMTMSYSFKSSRFCVKKRLISRFHCIFVATVTYRNCLQVWYNNIKSVWYK